MLENFYGFSHNVGLHVYTIPTLVVALVLVVMVLVHNHNQKKRQKDFEEEMEKKFPSYKDSVTG